MESNEINLESTSYILPNLGIQKHHAAFEQNMQVLIEHLRSSYPDHYVERVKERFICHSQISLAEWEHRWFEWERYLIIKAILPSVQMYSSKVDEVWHEMLLFTQRYMEFSKKYLNTMLHHTPNEPDHKFSPHDRAWFDLIYVLLFQPTRYSQAVWGTFFRYPLSPKMIKDFQTLSTNQLQKKYFNSHAAKHVPRVAKLISQLIQLVQKEISANKKYFENNRWTDPSLQYLSGFLLLSAFQPEEISFEEDWNDPEEKKKKDKDGGCDGGGGGDGGGCSGCGGCGGCGG